MIRFQISGESIELIKLLKASGLCESGGAAKQAVASGEVTVDGKPEERKRCKIRAGQIVSFAGEILTVVAPGSDGKPSFSPVPGD